MLAHASTRSRENEAVSGEDLGLAWRTILCFLVLQGVPCPLRAALYGVLREGKQPKDRMS